MSRWIASRRLPCSTDLYKVWWLAKESAASNGRYRNFQEASHFVLGQQFLHWIC